MGRMIPNLTPRTHDGGRPVWDDVASTEDLELLERGTEGWEDTPDVLIVGAGIVGLAVAAFCRKRGLSTLVVERERIAGGASGRAAGGLAPEVHPELGDEWHVLARESFELHRSLDAAWHYGMRMRDVVVSPDSRIAGQGHVDPVRLAAAFTRRAGIVRPSTACAYTLTGGGKVVRVVTDGGVVSPGSIVFATGTGPPQTPGVCNTLVKGHLIATAPAAVELDVILSDGDILVAQLADGRLIGGGTKDRSDVSKHVDASVVASIRQRMSELVPGVSNVEVTHAWCCFRPCGADELPVIDRVAGLSNAFVAAGFYSTGILMAPVVGRLVSGWVAGDAFSAAFGVRR